jgi:hypothetical protein
MRASGRSTARLAGLLAAGVLLAPSVARAQGVTRVMIRAVAHDAKIIGSGAGGARISVFDARTGSLLARGMQEGGSGDTRKLVTEPRARGASVYDTEEAAGFLAELQLEGPTQVRIEAEGPLGNPSATQRVTRTMLLVPGQDVLGDGVILELYGFAVELLEPSSDLTNTSGSDLQVRARVTMLCGCPTEPGGIWDSSDYTIEARIVQDGQVLRTASLAYAGEASTYQGVISVPAVASEEGLSLQVLAMDAARANFGMVERRFDEMGSGQSSE